MKLKEAIMGILSFIGRMLPYMGIALVIYIIVRRFMIRAGKAQRADSRREIAGALFVMYCAAIAAVTILPSGGSYVIGFSADDLNLIPLQITVNTFKQLFKGSYSLFVINFLGNIIVFMPLGFFVMLLYRPKLWKCVLVGTFSSLFIEVCQIFIIGRKTDIDDIFLNTAGCFAGAVIYKLCFYIRENKKKKRKTIG